MGDFVGKLFGLLTVAVVMVILFVKAPTGTGQSGGQQASLVIDSTFNGGSNFFRALTGG